MTMRIPRGNPVRNVVCAALVAAMAVATGTAPADAAAKRRARLLAFSDCASLVRYADARAPRYRVMSPLARNVAPMPGLVDSRAMPEGAVPPVAAGPMPEAPAGTTGGTSTANNQEAGIDEPDIVKWTDSHVYVLQGDTLNVVEIGPGPPKLAGSLAIAGAAQLLVSGDRALVFGQRWSRGASDERRADDTSGAPARMVAPGTSQTVLTEVDISDPAQPKVAREMTLDGAYVTARLTGDVARVVVTSTPRAVSSPLRVTAGRSARVAARRPATARVRRYVPQTTIRSKLSGRTYRRGVVGCTQVRRPSVYAGLALTTVLTVDLSHGLMNVDRDAVLADADTIYASPRSLYVATHAYSRTLNQANVPAGESTDIYRFDTSRRAISRYTGAGTVDGLVLNQFSLSEEDGVLRVATTTQPSWLPGGTASRPSQSSVTTLDAGKPGPLAELGRVDGLGTDERIYAVRFIGKTGYVVTFRQVDPLYTIDLSNPARPKVAGELKLLGYSAYLHPVGDGLLLGVGRDADAGGRTTGAGVSLFDVSDPARPRLRSRLVYPDASTGVEYDHLAFLWWAPAQLALIPSSSQAFSGLLAIGTGGGTLTERGRLSHPRQGSEMYSYTPDIQRSLIAAGRLYTLGYDGLQVASLETLQPQGFLALAPPQTGGDVVPQPVAVSPPAPR